MIILGLNVFHADAAACLVRDGVLVAAAEEERFCRVKHWSGFPAQAIAWCLAEARVDLADVDVIALNQDSRANLGRKLRYLLTGRPGVRLVAQRLRTRRARAGLPELLEEAFPDSTFRGRIVPVEHHLAHLSSAFHVSPFGDAVAVSVDGFGDFASTAWGTGSGTSLEVEGRVFFPHSLGVFYQAVTQFLGFPHYGDEYKVMGLAPYGEPKYLDEMRQIVGLKNDGGFFLDVAFFRHHRDELPFQWESGAPEFADLFSSELMDLLGPRRRPGEDLGQRHKDIAASAQAMYEEAFFHLLERLRERSGLSDVALAGGCANNSAANGKVRRRTGFERVYVHAAPGDAGGAIGAAFAHWHRSGGDRRFVMRHAFWGPDFGDAEIAALLEDRSEELSGAGCSVERIGDEAALCRQAAERVAAGDVVGWFQGRMEWGPRALGNRSILGDPRRDDMKAILNSKIKRRESFRPFAPSVLEEFETDWFEEDGDVPFMAQVFQIREHKRPLVPAVAHVDGSGRLQTVHQDANPRYHRLISEFRELTGVPMVLNTSFNENEPVVCRPQEALDCFLRTEMDMLVLGDRVVRRS
ncbi:carbamoyltransferase family protein [Microbaculum marinum]|uniref:Carbamoyltransferase C-terminal domain-containing protein n=1 Tax=Microbaculum marinum TaxID=1764581 RepID=A0AAW9RYY6_9HYPH